MLDSSINSASHPPRRASEGRKIRSEWRCTTGSSFELREAAVHYTSLSICKTPIWPEPPVGLGRIAYFPPQSNRAVVAHVPVTMKRILRTVLWLIVAALVAIQLVPVDRSNPPVTREVAWDSPDTRAIAERACFACHSNETAWPWYAYVAPVSWRVASHVERGRGHLNFSEWDQPNEDLDEVVEVIRDHEMPLRDYLLVHREARLTADERELLIAGFERTFTNDPPVERRRPGGPPPGAPAQPDSTQ